MCFSSSVQARRVRTELSSEISGVACEGRAFRLETFRPSRPGIIAGPLLVTFAGPVQCTKTCMTYTWLVKQVCLVLFASSHCLVQLLKEFRTALLNGYPGWLDTTAYMDPASHTVNCACSPS
jgi:hypothetical protein